MKFIYALYLLLLSVLGYVAYQTRWYFLPALLILIVGCTTAPKAPEIHIEEICAPRVLELPEGIEAVCRPVEVMGPLEMPQ